MPVGQGNNNNPSGAGPLAGSSEFFGFRPIVVTADTQLTPDHSGAVIVCNGAGAITLTLPEIGLGTTAFTAFVINVANQNVTIASRTADTLVALNDATADSVALSAANKKIGSMAFVYIDGVRAFCVPMFNTALAGTDYTIAT